MNYSEAVKLAAEANSRLLANDFCEVVQVSHSDGSFFIFHGAFRVIRDDFAFIFTEHHGFHVYYLEDIDRVQCLFYNVGEDPEGLSERLGELACV